jgi:rhodanese-related sulfurtransferase
MSDEDSDALIRKLLAALKPFADAAEVLDETDRDEWEAWEHPVAMNVKIGDFRKAQAVMKGASDD